MGKKSKKGVSRAGQKQRPKAGAGKTRTKSMDGSAHSNDAVPATTTNGGIASTVPCTGFATPAAAAAAVTAANQENGVSPLAVATGQLDLPPPVKETDAIPDDVIDKSIVKAAEDALKKAQEKEEAEKRAKIEAAVAAARAAEKENEEAEKRAKVEAAVAAARAAEEKKAQPVVVQKNKPEPAVEKKATVETKPKAAPAPAAPPKAQAKPTEARETKSRGLALDQPAPEEAAAKQKDCECIIL
mmetsp:Transcript_11065/g.22670  ORF Transcript_11065/g.22670 Transcript_11065/m.22670 type:complete len:243 (-) Transcript_11065:156-884(-)